MESISAIPAAAMYRRPFAWLLLSWGLLLIPALGFLVQNPSWGELHPGINACLNASSAFFLLAGRVAIARRAIELHRLCMLAATTASGVFLISYVVRFAMTGTHRYPGVGWDKSLYLAILMSHMVLAILLVPLVLRSLQLGLRRTDAKHRRIARWTFPIWLYVSLSGVAVYLMLYPIAAALYAR